MLCISSAKDNLQCKLTAVIRRQPCAMRCSVAISCWMVWRTAASHLKTHKTNCERGANFHLASPLFLIPGCTRHTVSSDLKKTEIHSRRTTTIRILLNLLLYTMLNSLWQSHAAWSGGACWFGLRIRISLWSLRNFPVS